MRRRRFTGRVTDAEVVAELRADPPLKLNHHTVEGAWMTLKEMKGWRPRWLASGFLANGMTQERANRIITRYEELARSVTVEQVQRIISHKEAKGDV